MIGDIQISRISRILKREDILAASIPQLYLCSKKSFSRDQDSLMVRMCSSLDGLSVIKVGFLVFFYTHIRKVGDFQGEPAILGDVQSGRIGEIDTQPFLGQSFCYSSFRSRNTY